MYNLIVRGEGFELLNVSIKNSKEYQLSYKGLGITVAKRFAYFLSENNTRDLVFTRFRQFNNLTFSKIKRENIWGFLWIKFKVRLCQSQLLSGSFLLIRKRKRIPLLLIYKWKRKGRKFFFFFG